MRKLPIDAAVSQRKVSKGTLIRLIGQQGVWRITEIAGRGRNLTVSVQKKDEPSTEITLTVGQEVLIDLDEPAPPSHQPQGRGYTSSHGNY